MKHNNQIHSVRKFRKYWQRYVKTWFNQPARKKSRRVARDKKAAAVAPRPVAGAVRPVVHGATLKYNSKVRIGRGFSLAEIKDAGLGKLEAKSLGISVDPRRRNRSVQGKQANVQRLKEYKANLVVFPRNGKKLKRGWAADADAAQTGVAQQVTSQVVMKPAKAAAAKVECRKIAPEEQGAFTTRVLKAAWNDARLVGFREKRAKERADKAAQEALKKSK
jgi:large subunit ribosomal protein L13e